MCLRERIKFQFNDASIHRSKAPKASVTRGGDIEFNDIYFMIKAPNVSVAKSINSGACENVLM